MSQEPQVPYNRDYDFVYRECQDVAPLIRRVVAENPSPFTFHGTGTYIVGQGDVAIIDPQMQLIIGVNELDVIAPSSP